MEINNAINTTTSGAQVEYYTPQVKTQVGVNQTGTSDLSRVEHDIINDIEKANHIQVGTTECQFSIHEETKQVMIKLVDTVTKETVKEIPSEKILDMFATMCKTAGLFVDEKR